MALEFAHGAIQWLTTDALNADKVVSGLGFAPKAIRFYWVGLQSAVDAASQTVSQRRGVGFASNSTGSTVQRAAGTTATDAAATSDCGSIVVSNGCVVTVSAAGAMDGRLSLQSFDADGFTLNVDDVVPANITVFWEAWGGSDITDVTIGDIVEPAATGTQDYTATGFTATDDDTQVVMFAGVQSTASVNTGAGTDSGLCVGFSSGVTDVQNIFVTGNSDDASTAMDTDGSCGDSICLAKIAIAGGTVSSSAVLSAFGADQFTLNWLTRATSNRANIYMAVKGGSWRAGAYTINGNSGGATATVSGLPFTPIGLSLIGRMTVGSTPGTNDRIGLGSGSSTSSRRSMGVLDEDATASSACEIDTVIEYDQVLAFPSTGGALQAAYDINAMNSDGFQIIVDTAGGVASEWQGYLTFGDAASTDIVATLTQTLGALTSTGEADIAIAGALSQTLGALTSAGEADVNIAGTLAQTLGVLTLSSTGVTSDTLTATLEQTLGALTLSSEADLAIAGAASNTLGTLTATGQATAQIAATANVTLGIATLLSEADVAISANANNTLGALSSNAEGDLALVAVVSQVLGALTLESSVNSGQPRTATLDQTLGALTLDADIDLEGSDSPQPSISSGGAPRRSRRSKKPSFIGVREGPQPIVGRLNLELGELRILSRAVMGEHPKLIARRRAIAALLMDHI